MSAAGVKRGFVWEHLLLMVHPNHLGERAAELMLMFLLQPQSLQPILCLKKIIHTLILCQIEIFGNLIIKIYTYSMHLKIKMSLYVIIK
jgi:hypothetical protein